MNYCQFRNLTIKRMANAGGATPILPNEYQQVEYLQSSGTQYLNIGQSKNHQYYRIDFMQLNGVYTSGASSYNINGLAGSNGFDNADCKIWLRYTSPYEISGSLNNVRLGIASISLNTRYEFFLSPTSVTLNGVDITSATTGSVTSTNNCYVFTVNNGGNPREYPSAVRIYRLQTSSIDLYPCCRKSDNKPGMYDIVTNTFFTNAGTGEFIVGNNV